MKILIFWEFYPPDKFGFALAVRGVAFSKYLRRTGAQVTVFAPDFNGDESEYFYQGTRVRRVETYDSFRVRSSFMPSLTKLPRVMSQLLRKAKEERPDIIIVSQPSYTLPTQALLVAKLLSIPCVLDMQDIFAQEIEFHPNPLQNVLRVRLESYVVRNVDFIFAVLPQMKDMAIEKYGIPSSKFDILYNGFDSESMPDKDSFNVDKDIDLLHVGAPRRYYDTMRLIKAFSLVTKERPNTNLVFTSCVWDDYQREVEELVEKLGLSKNVRFKGILSKEKILELMGRAKVGVYTLYPKKSSRVVVGTKTFEYMAVGLPIAYLGPKGGGMDSLINENRNGISEEDFRMFAKKVLRILEDESVATSYAENARNASRKYDWKNTIPEVYRKHILRIGENR